jgi:hypothetical protein
MARPVFDLKDLMSSAEQKTGLSDWGGDEFKKPLECFVRSLNEEAKLTEQGVLRSKSHLQNLLCQRLRVFDDRKTYPDIPKQVIREPLFMTGLPRAGTSYLNAMIASDPANIAPLHWQMWSPSPPPNAPWINHEEQIARGHELIEIEGWQDPDLRSRHSYGALQAEEDSHIHEFSFLAGSFTFFWDVPGYTRYVYGADRVPAYEILYKILQALQLGAEDKRWVLKSPDHFVRLEALFHVFPDARVVLNHRDPNKVIASSMSLVDAHRRQFGNPPVSQDRAFALGFLDVLATGMANLIELRKNPGIDARFVDVNYVDLEERPLEQVRAVYDRFGWPLSEMAIENIKRYIAGNRKGKFGGHRYDLADYGVTRDEVYERFKGYIERFGVTQES